MILGAAGAGAQTWHVVPGIALESTLTDNVNLTSSGKSDWVNQLTPSVVFNEKGAHSQMSGSLSVPILLYARTPQENNKVLPQASFLGTFEAVDRLFFIDTRAEVSQQYQSPFGPRSTSLANATSNRYTAQTYTVSPYFKGTMPGDIAYELRDNNVWTNGSGAAANAIGRAYENEVVGRITRSPQPGGWSFEYDRSDVRYTGFESEVTEIGRARASYQGDPSVRIEALAGYEDNRFFGLTEQGATYGLAVRWHPDERTNLTAQWEHRFFGSSYDFAFDHTTRLSTWSFHAYRNITNYPQQLGTLASGVQVSDLLNGLFAGRVQDPAQRQTLVDDLIRNRGLPSVLAAPLPLLTQRITLVESESGTVGLLGARNSVLFTVYRVRNAPIEGSEIAALQTLANAIDVNNTQLGANAVWTHQLTPNLTLATNLDWSRVTYNAQPGGLTRMYSAATYLSRPLSALTTVYAGARYQNAHSDVSVSYHEAAVYVGITHLFR